MKKYRLLLGLLIWLCFFYAQLEASELKIAYVDLQRALNESAAGNEAKKKFAEEVKKVQDDILRDKEEIEQLGEVLEKQGMMLTEAVKQEKEKNFLKMQRDYERKVKDTKEDLQIKDAELTKKIIEELIVVIEKYGKENNYSFIFEKSETGVPNNVILYVSKPFDITDKIIPIYDAQYKSKNK